MGNFATRTAPETHCEASRSSKCVQSAPHTVFRCMMMSSIYNLFCQWLKLQNPDLLQYSACCRHHICNPTRAKVFFFWRHHNQDPLIYAGNSVTIVSGQDVATLLAPPDFHGVVRPCRLAQYTCQMAQLRTGRKLQLCTPQS
jgi:hypothetical protein